MVSLTSSSSLAPKVLPTGGGCTVAARSAMLGDSSMPFSDALSGEQPAHYGPQDLLACICAGGNDQTIFIYDMNSAQLVQTLLGHTASVTSVRWKAPKLSYLQHGLFLLSGDRDGNVLLWDVAEGVVIGRLRVPCQQPVQILSLLTDQHLLVVTNAANSYVLNAHLIDATMLPPAPLPLSCREGPRPPVRLCTSRLSPGRASALLMADRVRILSHLDPARGGRPTARDLIYDSEQGEVTVKDAFFSESAEEVLYFATPTFVGSYDWKAEIVLNEQILWTRDGVEFTRIFPSSPTCFEERTSGSALPLMYSFTTDHRLTAWLPQRTGRFTTVSMDVRGARITSKGVATVTQSELDANVFAVLFDDGSVCRWAFRVASRRWRMTHYCASPLQQPTCLCRAAASYGICCALESGHVAVYDARHSVALKRMNLVYSGGTRIVLLCTHRHDDAVWVVSCRTVDGRNHHQVSLLDVRSGEVVRVLRKPSAGAETSKAKAATMDATGTFLLLAFWNGTFEVWNTEDGRLIHMHAGLGVTSVSWAPGSLRRCVTGIHGNPELLCVVFCEGTLSLWSVHRDRCVVSRDAVPFLHTAAVTGGTVQSATVGSHLVIFDSTGVGFVVSACAARLSTQRLRDLPGEGLGPVRCLAANTPQAPLASSSFASFDVFNCDVGTRGADHTAGASAVAAAASLVAVVFDDASFGVWDVTTGERLGLSTASHALRGIAATDVLWLDDALAVLCRGTGAILIVDRRLARVNSPVTARALRRPLQNPSFLLPAQRTHLQTSMELLLAIPLPVQNFTDAMVETPSAAAASAVAPRDTEEALHTTGAIPAAAAGDVAMLNATALSSHVTERLSQTSGMPSRGPFGQLLNDRIRTGKDELILYQNTMLPRALMYELRLAKTKGDTARAAFYTARWFGQREKQRVWALLALVLATVDATRSPSSSTKKENADASAAVVGEIREPGVPAELSGCAGVPYLFADPFAVSTAAADVVRHNRLALAEARSRALQRSRDLSADDSQARLQLARELLGMGESVKAVDVLLECPFERLRFNQLSTLAVAIAAGAAVPGVSTGGLARSHGSTPHNHAVGSASSSSSTALFALATKRAAAMLLAAGEVDAAVEKFTIAGEYDEACRALESQGRWHDFALLTKVSPLAADARRVMLQRWAVQCARAEAGAAGLSACRILLSQGLVRAALELLAASAHLTDVAGTLAVAVARHYAAFGVNATSERAPPSEASAGDGGGTSKENDFAAERASQKLSMLLLRVLADYSSVLQSVGSEAGVARVLDEVAALKRTLWELEAGDATA